MESNPESVNKQFNVVITAILMQFQLFLLWKNIHIDVITAKCGTVPRGRFWRNVTLF